MGNAGELFYNWETRLSRRDTNRRMHPLDWGLGFVPNGTAVTDPKLYLFAYARQAVANREAYHSYKPVSDYRIKSNHPTLSSPLPSINPRNNTVHARYFPAASRGRVGLVFRNGTRTAKAACLSVDYSIVTAFQRSNGA